MIYNRVTSWGIGHGLGVRASPQTIIPRICSISP